MHKAEKLTIYTVKDNILFGRPYKEKRYLKTVEACDIQQDIEMFPDGNDTEVGERQFHQTLISSTCWWNFFINFNANMTYIQC